MADRDEAKETGVGLTISLSGERAADIGVVASALEGANDLFKEVAESLGVDPDEVELRVESMRLVCDGDGCRQPWLPGRFGMTRVISFLSLGFDRWWVSALGWLAALAVAISWGGILYFMGTEKPDPALHSRCTALRSGAGTSGTGPSVPDAMLRAVISAARPQSASPVAEGVGFEPTSALRRQQFSRLPRSTTPAPLQGTTEPNPIDGESGGNETRSERAAAKPSGPRAGDSGRECFRRRRRGPRTVLRRQRARSRGRLRARRRQ
jgi:hypothetical protein